MTRTVYCKKYQQELDGLAAPPFPGPKGEDIYQHVSAKAWQEWLSHQTMLINEKKLNLVDRQARQYLTEQMDRFFSGNEYDQAEGYVAPENNGVAPEKNGVAPDNK